MSVCGDGGLFGLLLLHRLVRALLFPASWERSLPAHYLFFALFAARMLRMTPRLAPNPDAPSQSMAHATRADAF